MSEAEREGQTVGSNQKKFLTGYVDVYVVDPALHNTCLDILLDERFFQWPASCVKHQAYNGGLADHTYQVMNMALTLAGSPVLKDRVDKQVLVAGILWHDYGKIWDYRLATDEDKRKEQPDDANMPDWIYTDHRYMVRHLPRSYAEFREASKRNKVTPDLSLKVEHIILSHHGRLEWQSPVEPMTIEAHIVHSVDMLNARF